MKKNKMMRAASVMLVATLATTCAFSGAMAKYVVSDGVTDQARVAKWGVILQASGNLFGTDYGKVGATAEAERNKLTLTASEASVASLEVSSARAKVVAPGTQSGDPFNIVLKGKPEVDGKITTVIKTQNVFLKGGEGVEYGQMVALPAGTVTAANFPGMKDGLYTASSTTYTKVPATGEGSTFSDSATYYTLEDEVAVTADYYPVVYTLTGAAATAASSTYTAASKTISVNSLNNAAQVLANSLNGSAVTPTAGADADAGKTIYTIADKAFESNTDLAGTFKVDDAALTWAWAFEQATTTGTAEEKAAYTNMYNGADTILGLLSTTGEASEVVPIVVKKTGAGVYSSALTENTDYSLKTSFDVTMTVEQVD